MRSHFQPAQTYVGQPDLLLIRRVPLTVIIVGAPIRVGIIVAPISVGVVV
jgi:hypothetical protein